MASIIKTRGKVSAIHLGKGNHDAFFFCNAAITMALGGVPMGVAIPPMLAADGNAQCKRGFEAVAGTHLRHDGNNYGHHHGGGGGVTHKC